MMSEGDNSNENIKTDVESPPSGDTNHLEEAVTIPNDEELEEEAVQHVTQTSIRSTRGAFAVIPGPNIIDIIEPRIFADDAPLSRHSSSTGAVAGSSLGASSSGGGSNNNNNGGGVAGDTYNYRGTPNSLPANIDIIAEATLVPSQHEVEELSQDVPDASQHEVEEESQDVPDATPVDEPSAIGIAIRIRDEPDVEEALQEAPCVNRRSSFASVASSVVLDAVPVLDLRDQELPCDDAHPNKLIRIMHADVKAYYWQRFAFRVCLLLSLLGIGLGLGLGLNKGSSTDEEKDEELMERERLDSFWNDVVLHASPEIDRNNTPPAYIEAINWMMGPDNDYNVNFSLKELKQNKVRYVLALIYYSTGGPGWTRGGLSKAHHCQWNEVIECGMNHHGQRVATEGLFLGDNNLNGTIPTEIGLLGNLKQIQIHNNPNLIGELPESLALLDLKQLLVQNTSIVGSLDYMCDRCGETILCDEYKADVDCDCCN